MAKTKNETASVKLRALSEIISFRALQIVYDHELCGIQQQFTNADLNWFQCKPVTKLKCVSKKKEERKRDHDATNHNLCHYSSFCYPDKLYDFMFIAFFVMIRLNFFVLLFGKSRKNKVEMPVLSGLMSIPSALLDYYYYCHYYYYRGIFLYVRVLI